MRDSRLPSPLAPGPAQQATDESRALPAAAWIAPISGTPFGPWPQPHAWLGRLVIALTPARSAPGALRAASAALVAAFVAIFAIALVEAGCGAPAALAAPLLLACAGVFRAPDSAAVSTALDAALFALVLLALIRSSTAVGRGWRASAVAAFALAVADQAAWLLVAVPAGAFLLVADGNRNDSSRRSRRATQIAWLVISTAAGCGIAAAASVRLFRMVPAAPGLFASVPGASDIARLTLLGPLSLVPPAIRHERSTLDALAAVVHWWRPFGLFGTLLAAVGVVRLLAARRTEAWLLAGAPAAVIAAAALRVPSDIAAIAMPAVIGLAGCAAVGAHHLFLVRGRGLRATGTFLLALSVVVGAVRGRPPAASAAVAREAFDRSLLASTFTARSALVAEGADIDRVLVFEMAGTPTAGPSAPVRIPASAATVRAYRQAGADVFALERSRAVLGKLGLEFAGQDVRIRTLRDYVATVPAGSLVAIAASAQANREGAQPVARAAPSLGGNPASRWPDGQAASLVGVAGASSGAIVSTSVPAATLVVRGGARLDGTRSYLPGTVTVSAGERAASITLDWRWRVETADGLVVALFDTAGNLLDRQIAGPADHYTLVSHTSRTMLFRVR